MIVKEYLTDSELKCHCGCGLMPPQESVERLYTLRLFVRKPMILTSPIRCQANNQATGGKQGSIHLPPADRIGKSSEWGGQGWDIKTDFDFQMEIFHAARLLGYRGFGFANTFIHIDDAARPQITTWEY